MSFDLEALLKPPREPFVMVCEPTLADLSREVSKLMVSGYALRGEWKCIESYDGSARAFVQAMVYAVPAPVPEYDPVRHAKTVLAHIQKDISDILRDYSWDDSDFDTNVSNDLLTIIDKISAQIAGM